MTAEGRRVGRDQDGGADLPALPRRPLPRPDRPPDGSPPLPPPAPTPVTRPMPTRSPARMPARNDRSRASGEIPPPRPSKPEAPTGGSGGGNLADYWCEALARSAGPGGVRRVWLLGRYRAPTSRQALNWLLRQADRLADLLAEAGQEPESAWHPAPGYGAPGAERRHTSPARNGRDPARVFGDWLADEGCQYAQLAALARGERVSVAAVGPDRVFGGQATDVCYSLIARPRRPRLLVASGGGWYRPLAISVAPDGDRWGGGIPATGAVGP